MVFCVCAYESKGILLSILVTMAGDVMVADSETPSWEESDPTSLLLLPLRHICGQMDNVQVRNM